MSLNLNQTLQSKYPHLEISVLNLSDAMKDNDSKRIDSEFFKKEYLEVENKIKKLQFIQLKDTDITIKHPAEIERNYVDNGIWFFRTQNLRPLKIEEDTNKVFISNNDAEKLQKNIIKKDDILITRTGANYGDCAVYNLSNLAIASSHVLIVKNTFFNQSFLSVFLNTKFGKLQIDKGVYGGLQPEIAPYYLKNIYIPIFPNEFQQEIETLVKTSHKHLEESKALYAKAEALLYAELGLNPHNPLDFIARHSERSDSVAKNLNISTETKDSSPTAQNDDNKYAHLNISVRTLKQSFLATGRLDSEYYQNKYDEIERVISKFETIKLGDLVDYPISSGATPKSGGDAYTESENGILFLRAVDLKNGEVDLNNAIKIKPEIHNGLLKRTKILTGDILFSIAGTIGRTAIYTHQENANINQALSIIRFSENKGINKLYFVAFFNSVIGQMYLEKYARQGLQTNLNLNEVSNLIIPKIAQATQTQIADLLKQSFLLRKLSSELLETAKAKVETAIEQG